MVHTTIPECTVIIFIFIYIFSLKTRKQKAVSILPGKPFRCSKELGNCNPQKNLTLHWRMSYVPRPHARPRTATILYVKPSKGKNTMGDERTQPPLMRAQQRKVPEYKDINELEIAEIEQTKTCQNLINNTKT